MEPEESCGLESVNPPWQVPEVEQHNLASPLQEKSSTSCNNKDNQGASEAVNDFSNTEAATECGQNGKLKTFEIRGPNFFARKN